MCLVIIVGIVFRCLKNFVKFMGFNVPIFKDLNLLMVSLNMNRGNLVTLVSIVGNLSIIMGFQRSLLMGMNLHRIYFFRENIFCVLVLRVRYLYRRLMCIKFHLVLIGLNWYLV